MRVYLVMLGDKVLYRVSSLISARLWAEQFNEGLPKEMPKAIVVKEKR